MSEFLGPMMTGLTELLGIAEGASGGALPLLMAQLENAGLAERVRSWTSHGENLPVTPEELSRAFPPEQIASWAEQAGTTPEKLLHVLSEALPQAVDRAVPKK